MNSLPSFNDESTTISAGMEKTILSVSLISKALKDLVENSFSSIYVKGEVSGFKRHTSGHCYFSLKDSDAVIDAVCWRGTPKSQLLRDGLEIVAFGKIITYPGRSKYQMVVSSFDPSGEGALLQLLLQLKEKLLKEGLFDAAHKKSIPSFPKRIGLITSPTGAVLRDIMHRLRERFPCHVLLKPVLVQGDGAAEQVRDAIIAMNNLEGFFISPRIVGDSVSLSPFTVILSVLLWSLVLGGLLGALLAVPLTATIKVLLQRYVWHKRI